jgi:hypothetical protein
LFLKACLHKGFESPGNAISVELCLSFQIATAGNGNNIYFFPCAHNTFSSNDKNLSKTKNVLESRCAFFVEKIHTLHKQSY